MNDNSPQLPICLTVAGLDPSGGAGIVADLKTFSALGCYGAAAISSVTFQNTQGVFGAVHQTADSVGRQLEAVFDDLSVSAVKTGMLPTAEIIDEVADRLGTAEVSPIVVDPVVRSTSGHDLIDDSALNTLIKRLFPHALLITPNLAEAERIVREPISTRDELLAAGKSMLAMGPKCVLIKGGHRIKGEEKAVDYLFSDDGSIESFSVQFVETDATHGSGCTLAAAIAAFLAGGLSPSEAVRNAKGFVTAAIRGAEKIGKGNSPVNQLAGRSEVEITRAVICEPTSQA